MIHSLKSITFSIVFLAMSFSTALAQNKNVSLNKDGSVYARVDAGFIYLEDIGFSGSASAYGVTVTATGSYSFDPGIHISGALGYRLNKYFVVEGELGYQSFDYDDIEGTLTLTSGGSSVSVSGTDTVNGEVDMVSGMMNLLFSPRNSTGLRIYVGPSLGFLSIDDTIDSIGTLTVNGSEETTALAYGILAGFDHVQEKGFSTGVRYRYLGADTGGVGVDDASGHVFTASVKFPF